MFQRILLAVDGSDHSARAVTVAAELARQSNGEIVVLHVREHAVARGGPWELEEATDAEALVERVRSELSAAGVKVDGRVDRALVGRAAQAILDVASGENADLIVMGSRGLSDLKGLLIGSVTHKVIQLSHCPVLVAR